jgi:dipeptidyl aminopeptidase/acylaminoacyl peptidase
MTLRDNFLLWLLMACLIGTGVSSARSESRQNAGAARGAEPLTLEGIARDPAKWIGVSPTQVRWSEDGRSLYFQWNPEAADLTELYVVPREGGAARLVPPDERRLIPTASGERNKAETFKVYEAYGDIFLYTLPSGPVKRITETEAAERNPRFTFDQTGITFERDQNLFLWTLETGELRQLTNFKVGKDPEEKPKQTRLQEYLEKQQLELFEYVKKEDRLERERKEREKVERGVRVAPHYLSETQKVSDLELSPDGRWVSFILAERAEAEKGKVAEMPKYVTKSGFVEMQKLVDGFDRDLGRVKAGEPVVSYRLGAVGLADGKLTFVGHGQGDRAVNFNAPVWSDDGKQAIAWAGSLDHKDAWLLLVDLPSGSSRVLASEHDDAWVRGFRTGRLAAGDGPTYGWMPDGASVYFLSERDGFFHLYLADLQGGPLRQLTEGDFELAGLRMSKDKKTWYFTSTEVHPGEHQLYSMPLAGGPRVRITPRPGWYDYELSPDERWLGLLFSAPTEPAELFVMENRPGAEPKRLTSSTKGEFSRYAWRESEIVTFDDGEGHTLYADLWKPARAHPLRPAVIQVHGGGWSQGVYRRWSNNFPFLHYLLQEGYTVLNLDYRGSRGYGRDFRTAIYRHMGETEIRSALAAVDYLVSCCQVDRQRIGIFGGSYGGFFTLMALFKHPGVFAAGAAHAPVTDWAHYNHGYTTRILNGPYDDDSAYRRSSPIYLAEGLQDHLLITHGVQDDNVHFQDSVRLGQRLLELKKDNWELMPYPVEPHGLQQEYSRLDSMRRRMKLFDRVLKGPRPPGRRAVTP